MYIIIGLFCDNFAPSFLVTYSSDSSMNFCPSSYFQTEEHILRNFKKKRSLHVAPARPNGQAITCKYFVSECDAAYLPTSFAIFPSYFINGYYI